MSKRRIAISIGVALLTSLPSQGLAEAKTCQPIPPDKIAAELYNFHTDLLTWRGPVPPAPGMDEKVNAAFSALHAAGFENVERFGGTLTLTLDQYQSDLATNHLKIVGSHESLYQPGWTAVLDRAKALGQAYVGSSGFGDPGFKSLEDTLTTARNLNELGKAAAAKGLRLYVHNHTGELTTKYEYDIDGSGQKRPVSVWEIVAANTDPKYVSFEVDVHWAQEAFGLNHFDTLLAFLERYRSRIILLHIKDAGPDGSITDLGTGIIDWPAVYRAAGPNIRYYIWEYDDPKDPAASAAIAFKYLRCGTE